MSLTAQMETTPNPWLRDRWLREDIIDMMEVQYYREADTGVSHIAILASEGSRD